MELVLYISITAAVISILTSYLIVRRVRKQVTEMSDMLADIKNGNGNRRILSEVHEIAAPLAFEINEIIVSYENRLSTFRQAEETNKQLMTSLSHDVRTPLTTLMYLWAEVYSICSAVSVTLFCFLLEPAAVYDVPFKILCCMLAGFTMATVSLPIVVIVIYMNQSFLLSLLLSFLYSVVNWLLLIMFSTNEPFLRWLPLMNGLFLPSRFWGWRKAVLGLDTLVALPFQEYIRVALYLVCMFLICTFLIIRFYKKWSR